MSTNKKYLIVLDFLYIKYEIEYKENMSPQEVIKKIQPHLFPSERTNEYLSDQNEETYNKFCLYRSDSPEFKGARFVTWNIKPYELDYTKYQFYLFRPFINVYFSIYVVIPDEKEKELAKAQMNIIYPIKKRVKLLKNYLKDKLQILTKNKEAFKGLPITGFSLQFISDSRELTDEEYIEQSMNGKEIFLIINPESTIKQNRYTPGRFYYIYYDPSIKQLNRETQTLDDGFTLDDTKNKLVRKHLGNSQVPPENVLITFNTVMLKNKFDKLDDLFCDNEFYQFVVIFEKSEININPIPETFHYEEERKYRIPVPENGRPNIIKFEAAGDPKPEPKKVEEEEEDNIEQPTDKTKEAANNNNNILNETNNEKSSKENKREEIKEPFIEEEEEELDDEEIENENENEENEDEDEEKLLDKFCYYFMKFSQVKKFNEKKTPNPSYFKNLSNEEANLLKTFKKYYQLYRHNQH